MDYFRAIVKNEEKSPRALKVTASAIKLNAANYTAWWYRRLILESLDADVDKELEWTQRIALKNPKNYQIWYHRRVLVERSNNPSAELKFTEIMLDEDSKNYHAWAHRQWVLQNYGLWDDELSFTEAMIKKDIRNNSAWNQRYFVLSCTKDINDLALKKDEIDYAFSIIQRSPNNASPWNYMKGMFKGIKFSDIDGFKETIESCLSKYPICPHVYSLLVDIYEQEETEESLNTAIEYCGKLEKNFANIQAKYWIYRADVIQQKLQNLQQ
eukprot:CAMPEP_0174262900 /NCGR_PEP_ID=MMETSP0439-20130205/16061_1 /TAXON_ID=0 /ORGANISM="Stereomyxa ramosa, Strain Chinc5" /LENGTH=268 /DNA_ID=CAMNT_0015347939 /DNA_START=45 /DNA_END=851 /DNA_ORIENTATION=-